MLGNGVQVCPRPEVVEVWDVTAQDPKLLVYLKVLFAIIVCIIYLHKFNYILCLFLIYLKIAMRQLYCEALQNAWS